jgi:hypothetical protein
MAGPQEHMVAGPDAMVMRLFGHMITVMMTMIVVMMMIMAMVIMAAGMAVRMPVQGVVVRHGASLARYRRKISSVCRAISRKSGWIFRSRSMQTRPRAATGSLRQQGPRAIKTADFEWRETTCG